MRSNNTKVQKIGKKEYSIGVIHHLIVFCYKGFCVKFITHVYENTRHITEIMSILLRNF